jgi:broad specificity phosphatase PhoE
METHFFLSRHGETQWNKIKKLQGQLDSPLTDNGLVQANNIASYFKVQPIDLIISSPLKRALNTAKICQQHLKCPVVQYSNLMERHFGDWQGQYVKDIEYNKDYQKIFLQVTTHKPPNGESASACSFRFRQALMAIAKTNSQRNILVVTHGDILRCFLSDIGLAPTDNVLNQYNNGCLMAISYNHQKKRFSANIQFSELLKDYA